MIAVKDRDGLIGELANTMVDRASVDKLKEVYRHSVVKDFTNENPFVPDYLILEVCEKYNLDVSKYVEEVSD
jgi:hypothetical protein